MGKPTNVTGQAEVAGGVKPGRTALDAVHLVAVIQAELCQARPILVGDAGN